MTSGWESVDAALERQKDEEPYQHSAFLAYLAMGEGNRSLRKLAEHYSMQRLHNVNVPTTRLHTLGRWSSQHRWKERCALYDDGERMKRLAQSRQELEAMNKRHAQLAQAFQARVLEWLQDADNRLSRPQDVAVWTKLSIDVERRARGLPGDLLDLMSMSNEELIARNQSLLDAIRGQLTIDVTPSARPPMLELPEGENESGDSD